MIDYTYYSQCALDRLVGKRIVRVDGLTQDSDLVEFLCDDGTRYGMLHFQDCCESVTLDEFDGRASGLVTSASERTEKGVRDEWGGSFTHTFYVIETEGGTLHLRWNGESNGYYSEAVYFCERAAAQGVKL